MQDHNKLIHEFEVLKETKKSQLQNLQDELVIKNNQYDSLEASNAAYIRQLLESKIEVEIQLKQNLKTRKELTLKNNCIQDLKKIKLEREKQIKNLQGELASKDLIMTSYDVSKMKYRKLQQLLASKVFCSNSRTENLDTLLDLDIESLFEKYEQTIQTNTSVNINLEETLKTLNDVKTKLNLEKDQREKYEKYHFEMMDILNLCPENRSVPSILQAIRDLKEPTTSEKNELGETLETLNDVKTKLNLQKDQQESYEKQHIEIMHFLNLSSEKQSVPNILQAIKDLKETTTSDKDKLVETLETLNDVKTKFNLQKNQRELYENQHCEMMDILNISSENGTVPDILQAIRDLKDSLDESETKHYSNAQEIINQYQLIQSE